MGWGNEKESKHSVEHLVLFVNMWMCSYVFVCVCVCLCVCKGVCVFCFEPLLRGQSVLVISQDFVDKV